MPRSENNAEQRAAVADLINDLADAVFPSPAGHAFVSISIGRFHQTLAITDPRFHDWLINRFHIRTGAPLPENALRLVVRTLRARAHCSGRFYMPGIRAAGCTRPKPRLFIDLCNTANESVAIDENGWRVTSPEVMFHSVRGQLPLPHPEAAPSPRPNFLTANNDLLNWAVAALQPDGPYPILILQGPSGSGKTTIARSLRMLLDPGFGPLHPLPSRGTGVIELATRSRVLAFDHVTHMSNSVADALCRISSGTCVAVRVPGDRRDALHLDIARPVILTAAEDWKPRSEIGRAHV